jgi:Beta propeller domain
MSRLHGRIWGRRCAAALLVATVGCADDSGTSAGTPTQAGVFDPVKLRDNELVALRRSKDCPDLLTQVQDDAIAKLALAVERFRKSGYVAPGGSVTVPGGGAIGVGFADAGAAFLPPSAQPSAGEASGAPESPVSGVDSANGGVTSGGAGSSPSPGSAGGGKDTGATPTDTTTASDTNTQVEGVDEADFVKVVDNGKAMFLLHGQSLRKLTTWPPEDLALAGEALAIEGQPSEMFVTEGGVAVVFSSVSLAQPDAAPVGVAKDVCTPFFCRGSYGAWTKITVVDVSGTRPSVQRELYYQGAYTSSRRHGDVVRVVLGASAPYGDLFTPRVDTVDAFGNAYDEVTLEEQLLDWQERSEVSIRKTELANWLPLVKEKKGGALVDVAPTCDTYFTPSAGVTDYGLTHVLSLDTSKPTADVGGVTILGSTSTVYASADALLLAQPDYRFAFGFVPEERTALHLFALDAADTRYSASGGVRGLLPAFNPQFGLDVTGDGVIRVATTGRVRVEPDAAPNDPDFNRTDTDNRVRTLRATGDKLSLVGESKALGHPGEDVKSARFVGDRGYVVTFRNTDPLIVLDVAKAESPEVLGEIVIPGFSTYMHPLDADHLITFGEEGQGGNQLQLFDVSHPERGIPAPKTLSFGPGSSSQVSYSHKAFTYFAEQQLIALPVYGFWYDPTYARQAYGAGLKVVHVDAEQGFELRGTIDHAQLFSQQGCGTCDAYGCYGYPQYDYYAYGCYAPQPEVLRGHFVAGDAGTFVYGFSQAGVTATDLATLEDVASLTLPRATPGYGGGFDYPLPPTPTPGFPPIAVDGGVAVSPPEYDAGAATDTPVEADAGSAQGG